jgi:hydroxyacylglutathione hydrolase
VWKVGRLKIEAMHTPGHTPGSMSYILYDPDGNPWIIFTGDCLLSGDVGRMDLLGEEKLETQAGDLHDSIFDKILPLGDGVLLCPAHGAGSVCGSEIAERTISTIGLERQLNPKLQVQSKDEFISNYARMLERPPYFLKMESLNLVGAPIYKRLPILKPLSPNTFDEMRTDAQIIDTRSQVAFGGTHIPGSLSILESVLPNFVGWFNNYDSPILFVCDPDGRENIVRRMFRMGFDNISGYLEGGIIAWAKAGKTLDSVDILQMDEFCTLLDSKKDDYFLLDVRKAEEIRKQSGIAGSRHIPVTQLLDNLSEIPRDKNVVPLCPSGNRAMLAASLLKREGWAQVSVPVGGIGAWKASKCASG